MEQLLLGKWKAIRRGLELNAMFAVQPSTQEEYSFHADGTVECRMGNALQRDDPPWVMAWHIRDERDLVIEVPIEPMPEYDVFESNTEENCFRIVELDRGRLTLDSRPLGGESIAEFERVS